MKSSNYIIYFWIIAALIASAILYAHIHLQQRSDYIFRVIDFRIKIQSGKISGGSPEDNRKLFQKINAHMRCAYEDNPDRMDAFGQDSSRYALNVMGSTFKILSILQTTPENIVKKDSITNLTILVKGSSTFRLTFKYKTEQDSITLIDIDNLCMLYKHINCFKEYKKNTLHPSENALK